VEIGVVRHGGHDWERPLGEKIVDWELICHRIVLWVLVVVMAMVMVVAIDRAEGAEGGWQGSPLLAALTEVPPGRRQERWSLRRVRACEGAGTAGTERTDRTHTGNHVGVKL
jgi:hypothetical protein